MVSMLSMVSMVITVTTPGDGVVTAIPILRPIPALLNQSSSHVFLTLPLSPPFPLVQIRINIHSFLVQFVTGIHFPLNHAYS